MKKESSFLAILITMLIIGTPSAYVFAFQATNSTSKSIIAVVLYIIVLAVSSLVVKLWGIFEVKLSQYFSKWLEQEFQFSLSKHQRSYLEYIIATNQYLDTRKIFGQEIPHHFELEEIVIPPTVRPYYYDDDDTELILSELIKKGKNGYGTRVVILGRPGSGKTTLVQQTALALAKNRMRLFKRKNLPHKIPVVVSIEELASKIQDNVLFTLPQIVVEDHKKRGKKLSDIWIEKYLKHGQCVVLIDSIDSIANAATRQKVMGWIKSQIDLYPYSHFVLTSRPNGYLSNPIVGVNVLRISDLTFEQINGFIQNWYFANEMWRSKPTENKKAIRIRAQEGANKLISKLDSSRDLKGLAVNPLLLTMITIVFSAFENLPGRRVELYAKMTEVSLEQRWRKIIELDDPLSRLQKERILQQLAYRMSVDRTLRIGEQDLIDMITPSLAAVSQLIQPEGFLKLMTEVYGLIVEAENKEYEFAHKTFQEYLSASFIKNENQPELLYQHIDDDWWEETIRLHAAQTNATPIIERCLDFSFR